MDRGELERLDREALVVRAQAAGIRRARILTRPELIDELLRLDSSADEGQLRKSRGFFGRARDLVARVVERGLHLPDAAERIRTLAGGADPPYAVPRKEPQALPTVTLAEIYAAQGHHKRALDTLRRVLEREPEHAAAQTLLARLEDKAYVAPAPPLPPEPDIEPELGVREGEPSERAIPPAETTTLEIAPVGPHVAAPDLDECFAIPLPPLAAGGGARTYVQWRVSRVAMGTQLGARPQGRFVVRAHVVTPSWDGPLAETRDRTIEPDAKEMILQGLPEPSVVRVAVGWLDGQTFIPFSHSPALQISHARGLVIWTPKGEVKVSLDDPPAASLARALDGSRRAAEALG